MAEIEYDLPPPPETIADADELLSWAKDLYSWIMLKAQDGLRPQRTRQDAEPTPSVGKLETWCDSNDSDKVYLIYNDATTGVVTIELT